MSGDMVPVSVHLASVGEGISVPGGAPRKKNYRSVYYTVTLTSDVPAEQLLPASGDRVYAVVLAVDSTVVITGNKSDANAGSGMTLPVSLPWPVEDSNALYGGATLTAGTTARISVSAVYED